jgi:alkanesulfonate monooxygenase SsuD/methylene tetrahydromethanopterin reductase-like flavin-dependent oxidoreductase (luciferase family)
VERTVSVGLCFDEERIPERFGARWPVLRPSILAGSTQQVVDHVAAYREAGADTVILSLRPPLDLDEIERFAAEVLPELR